MNEGALRQSIVSPDDTNHFPIIHYLPSAFLSMILRQTIEIGRRQLAIESI